MATPRDTALGSLGRHENSNLRELYAFIPNRVCRVKKFLRTSASWRSGRPAARGYGFCPSSCRSIAWRKDVIGWAPLTEVASIVPSAAVLPMKKVGVPGRSEEHTSEL